MHKKLPFLVIALASAGGLYGQDSTSAALNISGSADVYFRYNFNDPKKSPFNNYTSFTNSQKSFELGMVSFKASHQFGKAGVVADLGFGKRAAEFSYNDSGTDVAIKQLYITYALNPKIILTIGSWDTHIGYESVDAYANRNYSMSYLFSYGPFFHTGLKAAFSLTNKTVLMAGIVDPVDLKHASNLPKMVIGQLATGTKNDRFRISFNFLGGRKNDSIRLFQPDIVATRRLGKVFSIAVDGSVQFQQVKSGGKWPDAKSWYGSAVYLNADPEKWLGFTWRFEYFRDANNLLNLGSNIFESTLSANVKSGGLTFIPEVRLEHCGHEIFFKSNNQMVASTASVLFAAVYKF
jgi:Putative beta-barrel porin-2, OmpL-like. bbp2